jgi:dihydrofolate synthase/folylpolyglutamate synthase
VGLQGARALPPDELAGRVRNVGANVEAIATDVVAGCQAAEALAQPGDRIVVFGSFLTVGPALGWLYTSRPWSA